MNKADCCISHSECEKNVHNTGGMVVDDVLVYACSVWVHLSHLVRCVRARLGHALWCAWHIFFFMSVPGDVPGDAHDHIVLICGMQIDTCGELSLR